MFMSWLELIPTSTIILANDRLLLNMSIRKALNLIHVLKLKIRIITMLKSFLFPNYHRSVDGASSWLVRQILQGYWTYWRLLVLEWRCLLVRTHACYRFMLLDVLTITLRWFLWEIKFCSPFGAWWTFAIKVITMASSTVSIVASSTTWTLGETQIWGLEVVWVKGILLLTLLLLLLLMQ